MGIYIEVNFGTISIQRTSVDEAFLRKWMGENIFNYVRDIWKNLS
jgi:hypothetical protein